MKIADIMTTDVVTLSPGHSVRHAATLMLDRGISGLPVVDDGGKLVGIVTEGDLLRRIEPDSVERTSARWFHWATPEGIARDFVKAHSWRVSDAMSSPVVSVTEDTPLHEVANLLETRNIKRLPVLRDGRLVGIVSRADLLRCIIAEPPGSIAQGDEAIRISVEARLREVERVLAVPPKVTVSSGIVHLWGTVRSEVERDTARVVAEGVPGIAGFEDHMVVAPSAQ